MATFKTDRPNQVNYVFREFFISIVLTAIPILIDLLFKTTLVKEAYYFIVYPGLLMRFIININTDRLYQIIFDTDKKQIIFLYKNLLSKAKQKTLLFDNSRVEINQNKSRWTWFWEPLTVYFLKDKMEVFEIRKSKDGFSVDKLKAICKKVQELALPVTRN